MGLVDRVAPLGSRRSRRPSAGQLRASEGREADRRKIVRRDPRRLVRLVAVGVWLSVDDGRVVDRRHEATWSPFGYVRWNSLPPSAAKMPREIDNDPGLLRGLPHRGIGWILVGLDHAADRRPLACTRSTYRRIRPAESRGRTVTDGSTSNSEPTFSRTRSEVPRRRQRLERKLRGLRCHQPRLAPLCQAVAARGVLSVSGPGCGLSEEPVVGVGRSR